MCTVFRVFSEEDMDTIFLYPRCVCLIAGMTGNHLYAGIVTAQWYRNDFHEPHAKLFRTDFAPAIILRCTNDNAKPHRSQLVDNFLQELTIRCMDSPARILQGPYNPIQDVWNAPRKVLARC